MLLGRQITNTLLGINCNVKLLVFDMAGTTINENGIVYKTLYRMIKDRGIEINENDISKWHGINKREVIEHFIETRYDGSEDKKHIIKELNEDFNKSLKDSYFDKDNKIELIHPKLPDTFENLRRNGLKIALNTGYSRDIQKEIINNLNMNDMIDGYISSEDVNFGRPYPYMINRLMEQFNIKNSNQVIKIGDTPSDIEEGYNAKCYMSVGVLSGASSIETYKNTNVDMIIHNATCIDLLRNIYIK